MTDPNRVGEILSPSTLVSQLDTIFTRAFGSASENDPDRIDISDFPPTWMIYYQLYEQLETLQLSAALAQSLATRESTKRLVGLFYRENLNSPTLLASQRSDLEYMNIFDDRSTCRGPVRYRAKFSVLVGGREGKLVLKTPLGNLGLDEVEIFDDGAVFYFGERGNPHTPVRLVDETDGVWEWVKETLQVEPLAQAALPETAGY